AEQLGLFVGETSPEPARERGHFLLVGLAVLFDADLRAANGGKRAPADIADDIADAPHGKGDHQEAEQALGKPIERTAAQGVEHGICSNCWWGDGRDGAARARASISTS